MKYWHELSKEEAELLGEKTWNYIMDNYEQPDWCNYPGALAGVLGCWSLTDKDLRSKISKEFCKECDLFTPHK